MSSVVKVNVRYNANVFRDVEVDLEDSLLTFKAQLWTLTGVPPKRQKIIAKGLLKDGTDLRKSGLKEGVNVLLVGSRENLEFVVGELSSEKAVDSGSSQQSDPSALAAEAVQSAGDNVKDEGKLLPWGLRNLGTTCYFSSIIQMLKFVNPFVDVVVEDWRKLSSPSDSRNLNDALASLFVQLNSVSEPPDPFPAFLFFITVYPEFASSAEVNRQQDAEQCLTYLLSYCTAYHGRSKINPIFEIEFEDRLKCTESNEDAVSTSSCLILHCNLGSQAAPLHNIDDSIKALMEETVEKHSQELQRNATYCKTSLFTALPQFLIIHLVRFEWKQVDNVKTKKGVKTKVCRKVDFSRSLDLYEHCSEKLKSSYAVGRRVMSNRLEAEARGKKSDGEVDGGPAATVELHDGRYSLCAVVTHQGRQADYGHYISWVVDKEGGENDWLKFDDADVSVHAWDSMDLRGGRSDHHIAYLCMYKRNSVMATQADVDSVTK